MKGVNQAERCIYWLCTNYSHFGVYGILCPSDLWGEAWVLKYGLETGDAPSGGK